MTKNVFFYVFFACFGVTTEVCFVAIRHLISGVGYCEEPVWALTGKSYIWMIPIYMCIPLIGKLLFTYCRKMSRLIRISLYTLILLTVEFISGFILEILTGACPWLYTSGWHLMGYIRLDYIPAWMFFLFIVEYLYLYLEQELKS